MSDCCRLLVTTFLPTLPPENLSYQKIPTIEVDRQKLQAFRQVVNAGTANRYEGLKIESTVRLRPPKNLPNVLFYQSGIDIAYPDTGVRGIYVPIDSLVDPDQFAKIIELINNSELNAVVIDIKDDYGAITTRFDTDNPLILENTVEYLEIKEILQTLEVHQIYPIARIVAFKDNLLAEAKPEASFKDRSSGELWTDGNGSKFINPFLKTNQDYILSLAVEAAKVGFKDIQLDYIRFPEGFETFHDQLDYSQEEFNVYENSGQERTAVISDFISRMHTALIPYNVKLSADIFGYVTVVRNSQDVVGIGQDFYKIAENVDVISAMIYPSHWSMGFFDIDYPNANPYDTIYAYMESEKDAMSYLTNRPMSRPWLQDFTDYDKTGANFLTYRSFEIQEQINALYNQDVREYLLWNAEGHYSLGVDYDPTN